MSVMRCAQCDSYSEAWDDCEETDCPERPTATDATAGDGLRSAIARVIYQADPETMADGTPVAWEAMPVIAVRYRCRQLADAVLALPALRDVLAAAARDAEKVRRVEALAMDLERCAPRELHPVRETAIHLRAALDPS